MIAILETESVEGIDVVIAVDEFLFGFSCKRHIFYNIKKYKPREISMHIFVNHDSILIYQYLELVIL